MNESIKVRVIELGKRIDAFLKITDIDKIHEVPKNILNEYDNLVNKISIDNWTEENIDDWFELGDRSQEYSGYAWIEGLFSIGTDLEKEYLNLILNVYHLIEESWMYKFRQDIYYDWYSKKYK